MDEERPVALVHEQPRREREMGVEAPGVVDGATGNDEAHPSSVRPPADEASSPAPPGQWWPAPTLDPAMGLAAPEAKPLIAISATMIHSVFRMPIWWLIQPRTGGPHKNAM